MLPMGLRTPREFRLTDKRYQVFVSSTSVDLSDVRRIVIDALLESSYIPVGMELFNATTDAAWPTIERIIDACDYCVVIVAARYGSVRSNGVSFTESEYEYAKKRGKPILAFLHGDIGAIPRDKTETVKSAMVKLEKFRARLQEDLLFKYWTNEHELARKVISGLNETVRTSPQPGWVRSDSLDAPTAPASQAPNSLWNFGDNSRIVLACGHMPPDLRPPQSDPGHMDYARASGLADLDSLMDIYGEVRACNPMSRVAITTAEDLTQHDTTNHLILIGGLAWNTVQQWLSQIFRIPIIGSDPGEREAIAVRSPDGSEYEFKCVYLGGRGGRVLMEEVGFFVRGRNPSAPQRTLTVCGGITTRGVQGVAQCFIDQEKRELNEAHLKERFPDGSTYCIVMRVPIMVNGDPLTPDLSNPESCLFEWCDAD